MSTVEQKPLIERLKSFARRCVEDSFEGYGFDGGDVQDLAEELGLIVPVRGGYDPEKHGESDCAEPGDPWCMWCEEMKQTGEAS